MDQHTENKAVLTTRITVDVGEELLAALNARIRAERKTDLGADRSAFVRRAIREALKGASAE